MSEPRNRSRVLLRMVILAVGGLCLSGLLNNSLLPAAPAPLEATAAEVDASRAVEAQKPSREAIRSTPSQLKLADETVPAILVAPLDSTVRRPAVVLVAGSGPTSEEAMLPWAKELARRGVVCLTYRKRAHGYTPSKRDYDQLAGDALVGAKFLRAQPDVDPGLVSAAGFSEGGWVVPLMMTRDSVLNTGILLSAPVVRPSEQIAAAADARLLANGLSRGARRTLRQFLSLKPPGNAVAYSHFDSRPSLASTRQPLLAVFGSNDATVPVPEAMARITRARDRPDQITRMFLVSDASHDLRQDGEIPSTLLDLVAATAARSGNDARPPTSKVTPPNRPASMGLLPTPSWLAPALLASSALTLTGAIVQALTGRGREGRRMGIRLAVTAFGSVAATWVGVAGLGATAAGAPAWVGIGAWALMKGAAVFIFVVAADAALRSICISRDRHAAAWAAVLGAIAYVSLAGATRSIW